MLVTKLCLASRRLECHEHAANAVCHARMPEAPLVVPRLIVQQILVSLLAPPA
jgi:hypothetical protein